MMSMYFAAYFLLQSFVASQLLACQKYIETQQNQLESICGVTADMLQGIKLTDLAQFNVQIELLSKSLSKVCSSQCEIAARAAKEAILAYPGCSDFTNVILGGNTETTMSLYEAGRTAICTPTVNGGFCLPTQLVAYKSSFGNITSLPQLYEALFKNKALLCTDCAKAEVDVLKAAQLPPLYKEAVNQAVKAQDNICQGSFSQLKSGAMPMRFVNLFVSCLASFMLFI
jgi:hypothetical protein